MSNDIIEIRNRDVQLAKTATIVAARIYNVLLVNIFQIIRLTGGSLNHEGKRIAKKVIEFLFSSQEEMDMEDHDVAYKQKQTVLEVLENLKSYEGRWSDSTFFPIWNEIISVQGNLMDNVKRLEAYVNIVNKQDEEISQLKAELRRENDDKEEQRRTGRESDFLSSLNRRLDKLK